MAHTSMGQHMAVGPRVVWSRGRKSRVKTRLMMNQSADFAARMLPSRVRNWLVTSQLPTTETVILMPPMAPQRRQCPLNGYIASGAAALVTFLTTTALVAVIVLFIFGLVYRQAIRIMKWMSVDEADDLGNKQLRAKPTEKTNRPEQSGKCVLPAYPENGNYVITNAPDAKPGESFDALTLTVTCLPGYGVLGTEIVFCVDGLWSNNDTIAKCVRLCKLDSNPSVDYHCILTGANEGRRDCNAYEQLGTVVRPECKSPNYYSAGALPFMRCLDDGSWENVPVCSPECGRVTPNGEDLMIGGRSAKPGELPWHVGIYRKNMRPYIQICGGSLVSNRIVISAAHCFWNDVSKQLPASQFAVAAGKIYRPWNNPEDVQAQKSNVKEIKIPPRFQGSTASFQDDIAVLILVTAFAYKPSVRPICLSFDVEFNKSQLQPGKFGKVAGWGLTAENGKESQILNVVELPYVDVEECIATSPLNFKEYITSDKICAGYRNGIKALCRGDSGGGLAFLESERGTDRYYLRGVVSTAPSSDNLCNRDTVTAFTQLQNHQYFLREYL